MAPNENFAEATRLLEDCRTAIDGLDELLAHPPYPAQRKAAFYDEIRQTAKLAEVEALLAIADRLNAVVLTLDAQRLTPGEIDSLLAGVGRPE